MNTTTSATPAEASPVAHSGHEYEITCSFPGVRHGLRASGAIAVGPLIWGISMGVVASEAGFSAVGSVLMSLLVFSGSAQMIAMDMMQDDAGMIAILISTALVSLRYVLMGMTMSSWFRTTPRWLFWPGIHYLSDQSWAMTVNHIRSGRRDVGYFFGLNAGMVGLWVMGTALGGSIGNLLGGNIDGLYFASTAALVGILAQMEMRRKDILPWIVAGIAAILAHAVLDGYWYMFIGVTAGVVAGLSTASGTGADHAER